MRVSPLLRASRVQTDNTLAFSRQQNFLIAQRHTTPECRRWCAAGGVQAVQLERHGGGVPPVQLSRAGTPPPVQLSRAVPVGNLAVL